MKSVRKGVFETNSSSVHTITIAKKSVYDEWVNGGNVFLVDNSFVSENEDKERYDSIVDERNFIIKENFSEEFLKEHNVNESNYSEFEDDCEDYTNMLYDLSYVGERYKEYDHLWFYCNYYEEYSAIYGEGDNKVIAFGYFGHD